MYKKVQDIFVINKIVSVSVLYVFDLLLLLVLLPFTIWKWISARKYAVEMLKAIVEVREREIIFLAYLDLFYTYFY